MQRLKHIHLAVGIVALIAFVLTGQYMAIFLNGLQGMADGPRLLYRSAHIYLLWSALTNLLIGARFPKLRVGGAGIAQVVASALLLATPILIGIGFATESGFTELRRPFNQAANYFALAGVLLHVIASRDSAQQDTSNK